MCCCLRVSCERAPMPRVEIDDTDKGRIVVSIGDQLQVGKRMLDFLSFEEAQAAIDTIGNAGTEQLMLQHRDWALER